VREPHIDIHQAEGGARTYWRRERPSLEGFSTEVTHSADTRATLGHAPVSRDSEPFAPKQAKNQ
jgi:hypothetical protein